jgi:3-phosphoglycerate kinase
MPIFMFDPYSDKGEQLEKVQSLIQKYENTSNLSYAQKFFIVSKMVSELDELLWLLLEDMRGQGEEIKPANLKRAHDTIEKEVERLEQMPLNDNFDNLIKIGTHKAKLNTLLRMAVSGKRK